ncbi:hypothetical protein [Neoasaia chiangmaiensis]|uniref:hypothetical protein n=1 Tax=Neoasaia chiangmaiensis TaxID=320497 RepID=UPI0011BD80CF|nr:hypothetical protein [Neoasaia chiangmaiensis]
MSESQHILFRLNEEEREHLRSQIGIGGFQQKFFADKNRLDAETGEIRLTDCELGKIIRYCSYGPGGFQNELRRIFKRSIDDLLRGQREK